MCPPSDPNTAKLLGSRPPIPQDSAPSSQCLLPSVHGWKRGPEEEDLRKERKGGKGKGERKGERGGRKEGEEEREKITLKEEEDMDIDDR
ncbi:hypothetical protein Tco_0989476 [Tanacetum coccineum]|uniref:Uncharacterized protein n=1 Tax=Tanacetum coccineum TaxID=301880 RepID=A0ABQ5EU44_9ASTR